MFMLPRVRAAQMCRWYGWGDVATGVSHLKRNFYTLE